MSGTGKDLSSLSMMDLFRQEAETHSSSLLDNLVVLRENPAGPEVFALLMRSAHSIKGAARIMDIGGVVSLANGMESVFLAARDGKIALSSDDISLLLQGAEKLGELAGIPKNEVDKWLAGWSADMDELVSAYTILSSGSHEEMPSLQAVPREKVQEDEIAEQIAVPTLEPPSFKSQPKAAKEYSTDLSSLSMMDLFRQEAETHCAALSDNLLLLEKNSGNGEALALLMRAAHSIKGAAQVIELHIAVGLAHAMEDVFVAAQESKIEIGPQAIDQLLKGVDKLGELANVPNDEVEDWFALQQADIEKLADVYTALSTAAPEKIAAVPVHESPPPELELKAKKEFASDLSSMSMVELFRQEAETHCETLADNLIALENNGGDEEALASLMRAAHSIKGAARVIELHIAVGLAHAMEDIFVAAQEGRITLSGDHVDLLLAGMDMFTAMSHQGEDHIEAWLREQEGTIKGLEDNYRKISHGDMGSAMTVKPVMKAQKPVTKKANVSATVPEKAADRSLRISAEGMNRLMGFAGEVQVESRWLPSFVQKMLLLKRRHDNVYHLLSNYSGAISGSSWKLNKVGFENMIAKVNLCRSQLSEIINETEDHARRSTEISHHLYEEVLANRMRPFADGIRAFPRMVRDVARELEKKVEFVVVGEETLVDRDILDKIEAPLNHLIRNAIDHGIEKPEQRLKAGKSEKAVLRLEARHSAGILSIVVSDDGCGIDIEKLREIVIAKKMISPEAARQLRKTELLEFIFLANFSTRKVVSKVSGRGVGLDVVHSAVQEVRGVIRTNTEVGVGTSFELQLPLTLSVIRSLLVEIDSEVYAFPLAALDHVVKLKPDDVREVEGRQYITFNNERVGLVSANQVFEKQEKKEQADVDGGLLILIVSDHYNQYGLIVDRFLGIRDLVVQPLDRRLKKVQDISSVALLEDGTPVLIVDVDDMVCSIDALITGNRLRRISSEESQVDHIVKRILVVDDSITVREVERKMLVLKGYDVRTAVDGLDGWNIIRSENFDLLVTDIDMPRMNGIELVTLMRQDERFETLPIIIVSYKDREEDRAKGLEVGADYYLTKGSFQDETLVRAVEELIGPSLKS